MCIHKIFTEIFLVWLGLNWIFSWYESKWRSCSEEFILIQFYRVFTLMRRLLFSYSIVVRRFLCWFSGFFVSLLRRSMARVTPRRRTFLCFFFFLFFFFFFWVGGEFCWFLFFIFFLFFCFFFGYSTDGPCGFGRHLSRCFVFVFIIDYGNRLPWTWITGFYLVLLGFNLVLLGFT